MRVRRLQPMMDGRAPASDDRGVRELPEVRYVHGGRGSVAYQVWGSGPRDLLLITEWATSVDTVWDHPGRLRLVTLEASISRVIRFDPRGLGASDPLPLDQFGNFEHWVHDALRVLDDVGAARVAVCGEGLMSHVALRLAAEHPERVERVVALNGFARLAGGDGYPFGRSPEAFDVAAERTRQAWGTGTTLRAAVASLERGATDPGWFGRDERLAASPGVAAQMVALLARADVRELLRNVRVPVLVLHTGDLRHVPAEHCRYLAENLPDGRLVEAPSQTFYSDLGGLHAFVEFLTGAPYDASDREVLTVVFTDVVGSTSRVDQEGDVEWGRVLDTLDTFVELEATRRGGRLVKQLGDGHLLVFTRPAEAVRAALALTKGASALELELRAGAHTGEVELRDGGDVTGFAVHVASRIAAVAGAGEVIVSRTLNELVRGAGFVACDLGERPLRGVEGVWALFALTGRKSDVSSQP